MSLPAQVANKGEKAPALRVLGLLIREGGSGKLWGSELSYLDLLNSLKGSGLDFLSVEASPSQLAPRNPKFRTFQLKRRGFLPFRLLSYSVDALRICRAHQCDVIYAHANYWFETLFVGLVVKFVTRKPLFVGILDRFKSGEDRLSLFEFFRATAFKKPFRTFLFGLTRRLAARSADACIVPIPVVANYASTILHARKAVSIGRGVSEIFFEGGEKEHLYDACFVGRIARGKGVPGLLDAWRQVSSHRPGAVLALAGAGDEQQEMEAMARSMGIEQNVEFLGYLSDPNAIHDLHLSSKLFVFPTVREGFARVISEAMASGLPCIVSDLPELRSVYADLPIYVRIGDSATLASAILGLLNDERERERLSENGRNFARRFTWAQSANLLLDAMRARNST